MKRKWLAVGIILLFVDICIFPAIAQDTEKPLPASRGIWLYVGGSGPGNYTKIQDAINNATNGDTVYVYDESSPYMEKIEADTSIHLLGEHQNTTVIDGGEHNYETIIISADSVHLEGFTIHGGVLVEANSTMICNNSIDCGKWDCIQIGHPEYGTPIYSNNSIIDNRISGYDGKYINCGILTYYSQFTRISRNNVSMDGPDIDSYAIELDASTHCIVSENTITASNIGILLYFCNNNSVSDNTISGNMIGIYLWGAALSYFNESCTFNTLSLNSIFSNNYGIFLDGASANTIKKNNFLNNSLHAFFYNVSMKNQWMRNYWDRPRVLPKIIFGEIQQDSQWRYWINIDWRPALLPNNIGG